MGSRKRIVALAVLMLVLPMISGCATPDFHQGSVVSDEASVIVTTGELQFPEPAVAQPEGPLAGVAGVPNVLVVPLFQSPAEIARFLHTTEGSLRYVNPRLPDPVPPGTLVVIPSVYRSEGETLSDVAAKTRLSLDVLQAANPLKEPYEELAEGELLAVPPLYILPENTLLSTAADVLGTDDSTLLSANPDLVGRNEIPAGTVLVVPPATLNQE
jgi:LysM repeat protein